MDEINPVTVWTDDGWATSSKIDDTNNKTNIIPVRDKYMTRKEGN